MQIKIYSPTNHKVKALIYWASWSWKTRFAWTALKPVFASAEWGLLSVADKNVAYGEIKTLDDLRKFLKYLQTEKHSFETVVIDSISEINDIIKADIEFRTGRPMQLQDWWALSKTIEKILRSFRDLPMHVLFVAQEMSDKDEDVVTKIIPSLSGKSATKIAYFMDVVGYITIDKNWERHIVTGSNSKYLTKDRSNLIGNDTEVDFSVRIKKAQGIKIGTEKVIAEIDTQVQDVEMLETPNLNKLKEHLLSKWLDKRQPAEKYLSDALWKMVNLDDYTDAQAEADLVILNRKSDTKKTL